jgi:hypothetical protein
MIKNKLESLKGSKFSGFKIGTIAPPIYGGPSYQVRATDYYDRIVKKVNGHIVKYAQGDREDDHGCVEFMWDGVWT